MPVLLWRVTAAGVAAVVFGGCSATAEQSKTDSAVAGAPTSPVGLIDQGVRSDVPADRMVWQADTKGGFVSAAVAANDMPEVTIYGDGSIFVRTSPDDSTAWRIPPAVEVGRGTVSAEDLRLFLRDVAASGLLDDTLDYGAPPITDMGNTVVRFHNGDGLKTVDVYGLIFDEDPLNRAQIEARHELEALIERSIELADETEPWTPDRVEVTDMPGVHSLPPLPEETASWPGPPFADIFDSTVDAGRPICAELEGGPAAKALAAATGSAKVFLDDRDEERVVVVRALLPDEDACDDQ